MDFDDRLERRHVLAAMERIKQEDVPERAQSTKYDVLHPDDRKPFPPKLVLSIAAELATGEPLPRTEFTGGEQTNARLRALGFEVVPKAAASGPETLEALQPGDVLTNDQLSRLFGVGNAGGMRWSSSQGRLVVIADHTKSLYDDRWEDDVLHYTGMGRVGDQALTGQNQRLAEQARTGTPVHLFEVFRQNAYVYVGEVRLTGEPRRERQLDDEANERWVYVFPLALVGDSERAIPDRRDLERIEADRRKAMSRASLGELVRRARLGGRETPGARQATVTQFERNPAVAELARRLAEGKCDLCQKPAPFSVSNMPYLECHHVVHLAKGGADTIENAVALCPNCHRRMHALDFAEDRMRLRSRVAARVMPA